MSANEKAADSPFPRWRSWHLHVDTFAATALDDIVTEVIGPLASEGGLLQPGGAPWFFIRYWQDGPHVRLRVAGLTEDQAHHTEELLADRLNRLELTIPQSRRLTQESYERAVGQVASAGENGATLAVGTLLPPGVRRAPYEPEYERYGGQHLMAGSERLFHHSSRIALAVCLARAGTRHALASGLEATAAACSVLTGASPPLDAPGFLASQRDFWLTWTRPRGTSESPPAENIRAITEWAAARRTALGALGSSLTESLTSGDPRWTEWTDPLRDALRTWTAAFGPRRAISIFGSHVHMTANRLGVSAGREAHIAALLLSLLESQAR